MVHYVGEFLYTSFVQVKARLQKMGALKGLEDGNYRVEIYIGPKKKYVGFRFPDPT